MMLKRKQDGMNKIHIKIEAACETNMEYAVGMSSESNGIFKLDTKTGESSFITMVPDEDVNAYRLYTTARHKDGMVYFTPFSANEIAIFDVKKNSISKKEIAVARGYNSKKKFSGIVEYGKYLFMTPCTYPAVIRIDTISGEINYYGDWANGEKFMFRKSPEVVGSHFYLPSVTNDLVLDFNMERCKGGLYHIGGGNGYWSACHLSGNLWFAPIHQEAVVKWNIETHKLERVSEYPEGFEGGGFLFTKAYTNADGIYMVPAKANMGIFIDTINMKIRKAEIEEMVGNTEMEFLTEMNGILYLCRKDNYGNNYLRLNMKTNVVEEFGFYLSDSEIDKYHYSLVKKSAERGEVLRESLLVNLNDLIGG